MFRRSQKFELRILNATSGHGVKTDDRAGKFINSVHYMHVMAVTRWMRVVLGLAAMSDVTVIDPQETADRDD